MAPGEEQQLARSFADMARSLASQADMAGTMDGICQLAVVAIDGCQSAGMFRTRRHGPIETSAATNHVVRELHDVQYELGEGPCLDAMWEQHTVRVDDMTAERRWPRFAERAAGQGVLSMLCLRLYTHRDVLGALDLFSGRVRGFDEDDREMGRIFASHAAVAMAGAQSQAHLTEAMHSRQRVGEATGLLAERHGVTTTAAFAMLARVSQERNIKVRQLAESLVSAHNRR